MYGKRKLPIMRDGLAGSEVTPGMERGLEAALADGIIKQRPSASWTFDLLICLFYVVKTLEDHACVYGPLEG